MAKKNSKNKALTVDLHTHSAGSLDATKPISYIINRAQDDKISFLSVTDHNNINAVNKYLDKRGFERQDVLSSLNSNQLMFLPGVEITCRIPSIPNFKGNPTKIHLLAYGIDRDDNSPISQVLRLKHINDEHVDIGFLNQIQQHFDIEIPRNEITKYISDKRKFEQGFSGFSKKATLEFVKNKGYELTKSDEELAEIIENFKPTERLTLDAKDVIDLVHLSGGIVILAHPYISLKRSNYRKDIIKYLIAHDIDGFEMFYPGNHVWTDELLKETFKHEGVRPLFTSGSDYHDELPTINNGADVIPYTPTRVEKIVPFMETIYNLQNARCKGRLSVKDYLKLKKVDAKKLVDKYKKIAKRIDSLSEQDQLM